MEGKKEIEKNKGKICRPLQYLSSHIIINLLLINKRKKAWQLMDEEDKQVEVDINENNDSMS